MNIIETNLNFRNGSPYNNYPKSIVLHHTECNGWTVERLHQLHLGNGWSGIGYHFYVRKDGKIYRGRPEYTTGAHCKGFNTNSLGISFEGCYNSTDRNMLSAQFQAGLQLIAYLKNKYGISRIYGHREVGSSDCPGKYFPLDAFRNGKANVSTSSVTRSSSSSSTPLWRLCINGDIVRRLQHELNVQFHANIKEDGWFGDGTLSKCITVRRNAHGNISKIIQERLIAKGAKGIVANGHFQDGTYAQLRLFQKNHGLSIDGICGKNTWKELFKK